MRRFLPWALIAVLALAVATPANAGYLIIRVILQGQGGGSSDPGGMEPGPFGPKPGGIGSATGGRPTGPTGTQPPGPGEMGSPFGMGQGGTTGTFQHDPTRSLVVVIPVEEDLSARTAFYQKRPVNQITNPPWLKIHPNHRGEKFVTNLFSDNVSVQIYDTLIQTPASKRTRASEIRDLHFKWSKAKSDPKLLFNVLTSALESGMVDDALAYADEMFAFATEKPAGLPPEVVAFARAYKSMQRGIKSAASKPNSVERWKIKLKAQNVATNAHYSLLYWDASENEVKRRILMLEDTFKGFFLWHATRGIELQVPDSPLIAVLPKSGADVIRLARALDTPRRMPADGFYAMQHDVLVLSPERLDDLGQTFARQSQQIYQAGIDRTRLLGGDGPKLNANGEPGTKRPEEAARMQTLALVDRLVEDNATLAAATREGSRQLLYATGLLPRYVELPEWLTHGSANFFTRPKDPAFVTDADNKHYMAVSMVTGIGGPNPTLQRYFKELFDKKDLHPDRGMLLKNVLTDAYFRGLRDPKDLSDPDPIKATGKAISFGGTGGTGGTGGSVGGLQPPGPGEGGRPGFPGGYPGVTQPPGTVGSAVGGMMPGTGQPNLDPEEEDESIVMRKKRERLTIKAHATAWALYYYLAKDHPERLKRFQDELALLPRDLPLDGETVLAVFSRVFAIENNKEALTRFATGWLEYIRDISPATTDIPLIEPKPSTTGMPIGPGDAGSIRPDR